MSPDAHISWKEAEAKMFSLNVVCGLHNRFSFLGVIIHFQMSPNVVW